MIPQHLRFHHLGLAAADAERAAAFLQALGYAIGEEVHDPLQNVNLRMCTHAASPDVEIIAATDIPGPLDSVLRSNRNMIYHSCWVTANKDEALEAFAAQGVRCTCITEPTPAVLFNNELVSFYIIRGFGMIEILESPDVFNG